MLGSFIINMRHKLLRKIIVIWYVYFEAIIIHFKFALIPDQLQRRKSVIEELFQKIYIYSLFYFVLVSLRFYLVLFYFHF